MAQRHGTTLADLEALAADAYARLLERAFEPQCEGLVIRKRVEDFPTEEVLEHHAGGRPNSTFFGLFPARALACRLQSASEFTGQMPNMIWLYRRPILGITEGRA